MMALALDDTRAGRFRTPPWLFFPPLSHTLPRVSFTPPTRYLNATPRHQQLYDLDPRPRTAQCPISNHEPVTSPTPPALFPS